MRRRGSPPPDAAGTVQRVAVLLGAGVAPPAAWALVAEAAGADEAVVREVAGAAAAAGRAGTPVGHALRGAAPPGAEGESWRGLACAWSVAERCGAPLAPCLDRFAEALRALREARRDVDVALSGPRASSRVVLALPVVGLGLSLALGLDVAPVLVGTPWGWGCLGTAAGLVAIARSWSARLVRGATPRDAVPGLFLELVAVALSGGDPWDDALAGARRAWAEALGVAPATEEDAEADRVLALARRAGAPAGALLRAGADERRREARAAARAAAERLGVTLMLPLGACVLPAFVVVAVVPLVVALSSSTAW